jgi:hypothetical protein
MNVLKEIKVNAKETEFRGCSAGHPRNEPSSIAVFDHAKAHSSCQQMHMELVYLFHDILSHGAFSVWMCNPFMCSNSPSSLFKAILHWLKEHIGVNTYGHEEEMENVYYHLTTVRTFTIYNRYK